MFSLEYREEEYLPLSKREGVVLWALCNAPAILLSKSDKILSFFKIK